MKTLKKIAGEISFVSILLLGTSCFTYKPITSFTTGSSVQPELATKILPGKHHKIVLNNGQCIFMGITSVTADTVYGDVEKIRITRVSDKTGLTESHWYYFSDSKSGGPRNDRWPWGDPSSRLMGLGRVPIQSIDKVSVFKFRPGLTVVAVVGAPLVLLGVLAATYHPTFTMNGWAK